MKIRTIVLLLAAIIAIMLTSVLLASAAETEGSCGDNVTWRFDAETETLTFSGTGEMIGGEYPAWHDLQKYVKKIVVGEGITSVCGKAFSNFSKVHTVILPESLQSIGRNAFYYCSDITSIYLSDNITEIGDYAFNFCSSLQEVTLPPKLTSIGWATFSECRSLTQITIHDNITEIDNYAFSSCYKLKSIIIPDSVTTLGETAFSNCYALEYVHLGSNVDVVGAFSDCRSLKEIVIPDSVTKISGYAFSRCTALERIEIGAGVSSIDTTSFNECNNLKEITIKSSNPYYHADQGVIYNKSKTELLLFPTGFCGPYTVLSGTELIGPHAASDTHGLTSLYFPDSVTVIDDYAFTDCSSLSTVRMSERITEIGLRAFARCTALEEILFPKRLTKIQGSAFDSCSGLRKITFLGDRPYVGEYAFTGVSATVYYPSHKVTWSDTIYSWNSDLEWKSLSCDGGHTPSVSPAKAPTCDEEGLTEGRKCAVCGTVITPQKTIASLGHKYGDWTQIRKPTEEKDGLEQRTCAVCGKTEDKILPKLGNDVPATEQPSVKPDDGATKETISDPVTNETVVLPTIPAETAPKPDATDSANQQTEPAATLPVAGTVTPEETFQMVNNDCDDDSFSIIITVVVAILSAGVAVLVVVKNRKMGKKH